MKIKKKGKVYPSSAALCSSPNRDVLSVLKLLPAAIFALISILSVEDSEVLAYLMTRSLKTTTSSLIIQDAKKKTSKKLNNNNGGDGGGAHNHNHKPPVFECDCFDCYTCYWYKWDLSPNRELIHQAIEAFEDHLSHGELFKKPNRKAKRRDKTTRRLSLTDDNIDFPSQPQVCVPQSCFPETEEEEEEDRAETIVASPEKRDPEEVEEEAAEVAGETPDSAEMPVVVRNVTAASSHKGLARKVLPDVIGLLNSRLWSLWSPNV